MQSIAIVTVFFAGSVGMWFGFVEDLKWAVAVGLAAWVGAVIMTFTGSAPVPGPVPGIDAGTADAAEPAASGRTVASEKLVASGYVLAVIVAMFGGTAALWYGFVEDMKYVFPLGIIAMAGGTVYAFRGTVPR